MLNISCSPNLTIFFIVASYLLGSVPFGLIIAKFAGYGDIRKLGSSNIGATNVIRNSNKFLGFLTLLCDGGKGVAAILIAGIFCNDYLLAIYVGVAAIIGHIFSIWLKFEGGKGVATSLAVFLILNWQIGLVACIIWLLTYAIFRISAVAALSVFIIIPIATYFLTYDPRLIIAISLICILVIIRHHENIKKLISKK